MEKVIIYKVTNRITNKVYVGLTTRSIEHRWSMHIRRDSGCRRLSFSIQHHGKQNFTIEEIYIAFNLEHANEMEDYFIKQHNSLSPNGYNLREGGKVGKASPETKILLKEVQNKRWEDQELRQTYSEYMSERWASGGNESALTGITKYIEEKKKPVVGFNPKTKKIIRYETVNAADEDFPGVSNCLSKSEDRKQYTIKSFIWLYDTGKSDEIIKTEAMNKIGTKKSKWTAHPGAEDRKSKMREGSKHRMKAIVSVNPTTSEIVTYEGTGDARRAGFSCTPIYSSIRGKKIKSDLVWFYQEEGKDYISIAKERGRLT